MSSHLQLSFDTAWYSLFFESPVSLPDRERISEFVHGECLAELERMALLPDTLRELSDAATWYSSAEGQTELLDLVWQVWSRMERLAQFAMPAHDARHAMVKVPTRALQHMFAEKVRGFERIGVLGALLHDYGRWVEERWYHEPQKGAFHSVSSFLLTREMLRGTTMPALIRRRLELSVGYHTNGADAQDVMSRKLVVAADRDQLRGPEIIGRLFHHVPLANGELSSVYPVSQRGSVMNRLTHMYEVNMGIPLKTLAPEYDERVAWLGHFLSIALKPTPEISSMRSLEALLSELFSATCVSPDPGYYQLAMTRGLAVPAEYVGSLQLAFTETCVARRALDAEDWLFLQWLMRQPEEAWLLQLAANLRRCAEL